MAIFWFIMLALLLAGVIYVTTKAYRRLRRLKRLAHWQGEELERRALEVRQLLDSNQKLLHERQRMLSFASHDLKGPFNRIFALTELFSLTTPLTAEQKDYLNKIQQINTDGMNMVRNLVENQRLEERGLTVEAAPVDMAELVRAVVAEHRDTASKKNQQLQVETPPQLMAITDKAHVTRILHNLLSNAIKFSQQGKNVFVEVGTKSGGWIIKVRDEGPGIKPEDEPRMYQKFQKLSARPTGGEASTGLGLWVARTLAEKLNLTLYCASSPGQGAEFCLETTQPPAGAT